MRFPHLTRFYWYYRDKAFLESIKPEVEHYIRLQGKASKNVADGEQKEPSVEKTD
jgi:hypothetical protein